MSAPLDAGVIRVSPRGDGAWSGARASRTPDATDGPRHPASPAWALGFLPMPVERTGPAGTEDDGGAAAPAGR